MDINLENYKEFINYLFIFKDDKYLEFNKKIVNSNATMIGIRTPIIKNIAKDISKNNPYKFLDLIKNNYYEETLLEGLVIAKLKEVDQFDKYFDSFILKIDNWAICDMCISAMKQLSKEEKYFRLANKYIKSNKEFISRVGYIIMMDHFLDDKHIDKILEILNNEKESKYYYVNMAKAWLISVCFVKFRDKTLKFLLNNNLDTFTHNKAIQKIRESYRVSNEDKEYLKKFKKS